MTSESVPILLETGDPELKPASFTRFVLPFAWKKRPYPHEVAGPRFVQPDKGESDALRRDLARRRYFSPETSLVLFERAMWLRVENWPDDRRYRSINIDDRPLALRISPPRVVLFEAMDPKHVPAELSTGFLLVDVSFASEATLDDLQAINELLRYWREPFDGHRERLRSSPGGAFAHDDLARVIGSSGEAPYFGGWQSILQLPVIPVLDGDNSWQFVNQDDAGEAEAWIQDPTRSSAGWICYTDDRAFVYTCAMIAPGSRDPGRHGEASEESGEWVRLLNVDFPSAALATGFERKWASDRTYDRWKQFGTLYGFSSHSAVMLGAPCNEPPTWQHFADMYFDQVLLLLYLRVTTFRFSGKLSTISGRLAGTRRGDADSARRPFAELRRAFAFFTNLYRFPLLSSQQQGIELYTMARQSLDVDELFEEVQKEIESTHEFFELMAATGQQQAANWLGWIATVATAAGIALTFLGLDIGKESAGMFQRWINGWWPADWRPDARWWLAILATVFMTVLSRFLLNRLSNRGRIVN